jgi:hypothetical protein
MLPIIRASVTMPSRARRPVGGRRFFRTAQSIEENARPQWLLPVGWEVSRARESAHRHWFCGWGIEGRQDPYTWNAWNGRAVGA